MIPAGPAGQPLGQGRGIEPSVAMTRARTLRRLLGWLLAAVMLFLPTAARAQGELRPLENTPEVPALVQPHDVPMMVTAGQAVIPQVPSTYVVEDHGWLRVAYPPPAKERVASFVRDADAVKAKLVLALGRPVLDHVEVRVVPTTADMARLAPASSPPPPYAEGVAYNGLHLVLLSMMAPRGADAVDLDEVFRHELAHVALEDAVKGHHVPVWFNEGLAIWLSGEKQVDRLGKLVNASLSGSLLPLAELDRSFPRDTSEVSIAYAESADMVRFLLRRTDQLRFNAMIERVAEGQPFERAIAEAYTSDLRKLEFQWRSDVEKRYSMFPILSAGGFVWFIGLGALGLAYVRRRRRTRAILERWGREEAIEDALRARAEAHAALADDEAIPAPRATGPKVEHDGRWHTLH